MKSLPSVQPSIALSPWQREFVDQFVVQRAARTLLVAAAGMGKTVTSLFAASNLLEERAVDSVLVLTDRTDLRDQWHGAARNYGIELGRSIDELQERHGAAATLQSLKGDKVADQIDAMAQVKRWLVIVDEHHRSGAKFATSLVDRILRGNEGSRALFISRTVPIDLSYEAEFRFRNEYFIDRVVLDAPATQLRVARYAPSFKLLQQLSHGTSAIDDLSWREFERLIATLLEKDGYAVELMNGSKDGGVDVVAVKDLGAAGFFKTLWQAKKQSTRNKVGISIVRELADTRQEFGASKGFIVTSSCLTRGAIDRINRDKYILGKVDRADLDLWVKRTLFGIKEG